MTGCWRRRVAFVYVLIMCLAGIVVAAETEGGPFRSDSSSGQAERARLSVGGVVLLVRNDLIEISIGSDDGLRKDHQLDVYRKSTYLGRVVVRRTAPDRAVAEIMPQFRKGQMRKGDRVRTKVE